MDFDAAYVYVAPVSTPYHGLLAPPLYGAQYLFAYAVDSACLACLAGIVAGAVSQQGHHTVIEGGACEFAVLRGVAVVAYYLGVSVAGFYGECGLVIELFYEDEFLGMAIESGDLYAELPAEEAVCGLGHPLGGEQGEPDERCVEPVAQEKA